MDRLRVAYGRTENIGNYESVRADCALERDWNPEKGESVDETYRSMWVEAVRQVERVLRIQRKKLTGE